jgi:hypothetical protein
MTQSPTFNPRELVEPEARFHQSTDYMLHHTQNGPKRGAYERSQPRPHRDGYHV